MLLKPPKEIVADNQYTIHSSLVLAFACLGDAFLYPILPANALAFNIPVGWVGIILSINRFVRLISNSLASLLFIRIGYRRLTLYAGITAAVTTALYGLQLGLIVILSARILWGLCFSALKLSAMHYALTAPKRSFSLGLSNSVQELGPLCALLIGPLLTEWLELSYVFLILALFTLLISFTSVRLPDISAFQKVSRYRIQLFHDWNILNTFLFFLTFLSDGVLVVLLVSFFKNENLSVYELVSICAGLLAFKRISTIVFSPLAGWIADYSGVRKIFLMSAYGLLFSILLLFTPLYLAGLVLIFVLSNICVSLSPAYKLHSPESFPLLLTARDSGAAFGTLSAGFLLPADFQNIRIIILVLFVILSGIIFYMVRSSKVKN